LYFEYDLIKLKYKLFDLHLIAEERNKVEFFILHCSTSFDE
jgi:hypothetical protein